MTKETHGYKKEEHKAKLSVSEPRVWPVVATLKFGGSVALPLLALHVITKIIYGC